MSRPYHQATSATPCPYPAKHRLPPLVPRSLQILVENVAKASLHLTDLKKSAHNPNARNRSGYLPYLFEVRGQENVTAVLDDILSTCPVPHALYLSYHKLHSNGEACYGLMCLHWSSCQSVGAGTGFLACDLGALLLQIMATCQVTSCFPLNSTYPIIPKVIPQFGIDLAGKHSLSLSCHSPPCCDCLPASF